MQWIKTSEKLPPIGQPILTCRKIIDEIGEDDKGYFYMSIMSLHRKIKKSGREDWIRWSSIDHVEYIHDHERPEYWMPFPEPVVDESLIKDDFDINKINMNPDQNFETCEIFTKFLTLFKDLTETGLCYEDVLNHFTCFVLSARRPVYPNVIDYINSLNKQSIYYLQCCGCINFNDQI